LFMSFSKDNITVMGVEIERKYTVIGDAWKQNITGSDNIIQGYLANTDKCSIRIRSSSDKASINIKSMRIGIQRSEFEYPIPLDEAKHMLNSLCLQPVICKTRYYVSHVNDCWEVDVFEGENAGLVVAEIELDEPDQVFDIPTWLGDEVSNDIRYYNVSLVENPFQNW